MEEGLFFMPEIAEVRAAKAGQKLKKSIQKELVQGLESRVQKNHLG